MEPERKPDIVDLARYKQAVEAQQAKRKQQAGVTPPGRESVLGSRPRAGLILVLVVLVLAGFWVLTSL